MNSYVKYLPGLHMFVAGVMFVTMIKNFMDGDIGGGFISAILFLGNFAAYLYDVRSNNEPVH